VGAFVNVLPLALRPPTAGSVATWLKNWATECTAAVAHRHTPLSRVSDLWADPAPLPVGFGVSYHEVHARGEGLFRGRPRVFLPVDRAKNELVVSVSRYGERWLGQSIHDLRVLDVDTAQELVDHFLDALDAILADPAGSVAGLGATGIAGGALDLAADFDL